MVMKAVSKKKAESKRKSSPESLKPKIISDFHKWQDKQAGLKDEKMQRIFLLLLTSVPSELTDFINNRSYAIRDLIKFGNAATSISFSDLWNEFNLSKISFMLSIERLQEAWKDVVKISVKESMSSALAYLQISFEAL